MHFAHVTLTSSPTVNRVNAIANDGDPQVRLTVDGVDITRAVLSKGFIIEPHPAIPGKFYVHMTIRASVDVDLPEAVLTAVSRAADNEDAEVDA